MASYIQEDFYIDPSKLGFNQEKRKRSTSSAVNLYDNEEEQPIGFTDRFPLNMVTIPDSTKKLGSYLLDKINPTRPAEREIKKAASEAVSKVSDYIFGDKKEPEVTVEKVNLGKDPNKIYDEASKDKPTIEQEIAENNRRAKQLNEIKLVDHSFPPKRKDETYGLEGYENPVMDSPKTEDLNIRETVNIKKDEEEEIEAIENKTPTKKETSSKETAPTESERELKESMKSSSKEASKPSKMSREDLLKMSGINVKANEQKEAEERYNKSRGESLKGEWNSAVKQATSGNPLEKYQGLTKLVEVEQEGITRGLIKPEQATAAQKLKKTLNDPYFIRDYNNAAIQENLNVQKEIARAKSLAERAENERKQAIEERKLKIDEEGLEMKKEEVKLSREEKARDKAEQARIREEEKQYRREQDEKDDAWKKLVHEKKYSERDEDDVERLTIAADEAASDIYNNALQMTLKDAQSRLGVNGFLKNISGEQGVEDFAASIENLARRERLAKQRELDARIKAQGLPPIKIRDINIDKLRDELKLIGPKELDKLKAYGSDVFSAGKYMALLIPSFRAGVGFAAGQEAFNLNTGVPETPSRRAFPPPRRNLEAEE